MADIPYVKFQRGTPEAWEKLSKPSSDTLYFISEKNEEYGRLYLGNKLIAGTTIGDLSDLIISDDLADGDMLVYNKETQKWVSSNATSVLKNSKLIRVMVPATETTDGLAGYVPQPIAGQEHRYLSANGGWETVTATLSDEDKAEMVATVKETVEEMTWGEF